MHLSIDENDKEALLGKLKIANLKFQQTYPGDKPDRQAVHTVYGGANLFKSDTCIRMGEVALKNLQTYAPDFITLGKVLKLEGYEELPDSEKKAEKLLKKLEKADNKKRKKEPGWLSWAVYNKIVQKLKTEP